MSNINKDIELKNSHSAGNDDEIGPTDEELSTLEHVSDKIPFTAWLIVMCEFCERFAYFGLSGPFQNYIQFPVPGPNEEQPGALGRGQQTATSLTTFFRFLCYVTPICGAILSDQLWGKYKTIIIGCMIYAIGLLILFLSSLPISVAHNVAFPGLIISMIVIGFGTGGVKSNVSPLMAEQYTRTKPIVRAIKDRHVIIDPKITIQSMFSWFYWTINIGALSSIVTTYIEKYHSFWLAYLLPAIVFTGSIIALVVGRNKYIQKPPTGSLLIRAFRVTTTAFQIRWRLGKQKDRKHILDYAKDCTATIGQDGNQVLNNSEHNQFIEDLKQAWSACRVFAFYPFYWICYNQLSGNMISQAAQMKVGSFPNDVLQNIDPIILLILIPVFDKMIYPYLRQKNIKFSLIKRISCGFIFVSIGMAWTALVQHLIYSAGPNYDYTGTTTSCPNCQKFNNISAAWQIPSYVLIAVSEIFASVTGLEYAFTQAPTSMKSIVMSLFLLTSAISNALGFALIPVTVNPKLLWMYVSLSIVGLVFGILFYFVFRNQEDQQQK